MRLLDFSQKPRFSRKEKLKLYGLAKKHNCELFEKIESWGHEVVFICRFKIILRGTKTSDSFTYSHPCATVAPWEACWGGGGGPMSFEEFLECLKRQLKREEMVYACSGE